MFKGYNSYAEFNEALESCVALNNKGICFEKKGDTAKAIKVYEESMKLGYPAHHSFKRLMVIYLKDKNYHDELRVIERALEVFPNDSEYLKRKERVMKSLSRI